METLTTPFSAFLYGFHQLTSQLKNRPYAPHLLIAGIRQLISEHPETCEHPQRPQLIDLLVRRCERYGLALFTSAEIAFWWDYPELDLTKILPPGRALPPGWPR